MKYITEQATMELASFLSTIQKSPDSWDGWTCLHIEGEHPTRMYSKKFLQDDVQSIIELFLNGKNGIVFFIDNIGIYIFSNAITDTIARDLLFHIKKKIELMTGAHVNTHNNPTHTKASAQPDRLGNNEYHSVQKRKVLLVEDDPVTRWIVRSSLEEECILFTASTAGIAIDSYHKCRPDLVFLDINLPDKSGAEVLNDIFRDDPRANIIMVSSQSSIDTIVSTIENGASGFITKPFTRQKLLNYIKQC